MQNSEKLKGLYVITDNLLTPSETLLTQVEEALKGGAKIVQLRDKQSTKQNLVMQAMELEALCKSYGALFVLNDYVEIAIELGLSGLHIGKSDYHRVKDIRKNFKGILGVSCYADVSFAKEMENIGVNYVAFGSFFTSPTKPNSNVVPLKTLRVAKNRLNIPVCAIGGLNSTNIESVREYAPDMIALISDIWSAKSIRAQSEIYTKI